MQKLFLSGRVKIFAVFALFVLFSSLNISEAFGFEAPELFRIGLESRYSGVEAVNIPDAEVIVFNSGGRFELFGASSGFAVRADGGAAVLYDGGAPVAVLEGGDGVMGPDGIIGLGERSYRGSVEFLVSGSRLTAVNVLTVEEYLYSVVPSEMPKEWHLEALKAQAVAARTYAMTRLSAHAGDGYHFCDRVHCQNYLGAGSEDENTTQAVDDTYGVIAYYNGEPINAVYSSSNGGYSEASENVWAEAVPYLRAVEDVFETSGMSWEREFTLAEIQSLLDTDIGTVTSVYISGTAPSGRVLELTVEGTSGTETLTKDGIRAFFSPSDDGMLESRNFVMQGASASQSETRIFIEDIYGVLQAPLAGLYAVSSGGAAEQLSSASAIGRDSAAAYGASSTVVSGGGSQGNIAVFTGRGWGHGVGMSQHGAKDMAEAGFTYAQILAFYYTGIEVR